MSEMIERVAKGIWEQRRDNAAALGIDLEEWGDGGIPKANKVFDEARAAIEAMREPTDDMALAAGSDWGPQLDFNWKTMIDAALRPSTISPALDQAIHDELDHPPKSIIKGE